MYILDMTITQFRARLNACARRKVRKCRIKVVVLCCIRRLTWGFGGRWSTVHSHSHWESWLRHSHSRQTPADGEHANTTKAER